MTDTYYLDDGDQVLSKGQYETYLKLLDFKQKVKEIILKHSRKGQSHYNDSWDIRPSELLKELGL